MTNGWSVVDKWPKLLKMLADWGGGMAPCPPLDPPLINRQNKEMEGGGGGWPVVTTTTSSLKGKV